MVEARGARFTLLTGYVFCLLGFLTMLLLWERAASYWPVALGYVSWASASASPARPHRTP